MGEGFLEQQIRKIARNMALLGVILLVLVGLYAWGSERYLRNLFQGPVAMNSAQLTAIQDPELLERYYVTVPVSTLYLTGSQETSSGFLGIKHTADLLALDLNGRYLLVKSSGRPKTAQFTGALVRMTGQERAHVVVPLEQKHPKLKGAFLPFVLDATSFRSDAYWGFSIGGAFFLAGLGFLFLGLRRITRPETHPAWRRLAAYGQAQDVAMRIDGEFRSEGGGEKIGPAYLTSRWLLAPSAFSFPIFRLEDVVWAHLKIVKHYQGFIPAGKSFFVIVYDRRGKSAAITANKKTAPALISALQRRLPGIAAGYSKELEMLWKKRREEFILAVEKRRGSVSEESAKESKLVLA